MVWVFNSPAANVNIWAMHVVHHHESDRKAFNTIASITLLLLLITISTGACSSVESDVSLIV